MQSQPTQYRPATTVQSGQYVSTQPVQSTQYVNTAQVRDRRINEYSARILARKVFGKYDANGSNRMGNDEAAQMISDLYASVNVDYNATLDEGLEFMRVNNTNSDRVLDLEDFEQIFVQHLSTGNNTGYSLFADNLTTTTLRPSQTAVRYSNTNRSPAPVVRISQQGETVVRSQAPSTVVRSGPITSTTGGTVVRSGPITSTTSGTVVRSGPTTTTGAPVRISGTTTSSNVVRRV